MSRSTRADDGIGLIEIIVGIVLLGVLALGILPLLVQATSASLVNRDLVAANAAASAELAPIRDVFPNSPTTSKSCTDLEVWSHPLQAAGSDLESEVVVADCAGAGTGTVTVTVFRIGETEPLVTISTKVMVGG